MIERMRSQLGCGEELSIFKSAEMMASGSPQLPFPRLLQKSTLVFEMGSVCNVYSLPSRMVFPGSDSCSSARLLQRL
jgi:hypothetical protein